VIRISNIAERGKTPAHLLAVVKRMGDTSVETANKHVTSYRSSQ
jgi:hypothetical protein